MKRFISGLLVLIICLFSGCAGNENASIAPGPTKIGNILSTTNFTSIPGSHISISGTAALPNGTKLRSQLRDSNKPIPWWPKDKDIEVIDGQWEITVPFGISGVPKELTFGNVYTIEVWVKDSPEIKDISPFGFLP